MDSFLRIYSIYRPITSWLIIKRVYKDSECSWLAVMWISKLAVAALVVIGARAPSWLPYFGVIVIIAIIWMFSFSKARTAVFADFYRSYHEQIKFFGKDNQYIRYLMFKKQLISSSFAGSIEDVLAFVDGQINTDSHYPVMSHPFITFMLGMLLAIVSGVAGRWSAALATTVIITLIYVIYFSHVVLSLTRTPQANMKEFKRFLLWVKDEQSNCSTE
jgi:hypothetical protein